MAAGVEEPNALVKIAARFPGHVAESMLPATTVALVDGLSAELLSGLGKLDPDEDHAEYDKKYVHTDVLVIGGGPAGLAAAREAVRTGARVILIDDQPELGGSLLSGSTDRPCAETIEGKPALEWVADVEAELDLRGRMHGAEPHHGLRLLRLQLRHRGPEPDRPPRPSPGRPRRVPPADLAHPCPQVVLAPGAHERPLVFENNDRPGIMLASAVRTYLNRYAVAAGSRVVISTTNDSAYALAADLRAAGIKVAAVVDARPQLSETRCRSRGRRHAGADRQRRRRHRRCDRRRPAHSASPSGASTTTANSPPASKQLACDLLAVSGGWTRWCTCTPSARASCAGTRTSPPSSPTAWFPTSRSSDPAAAASTSTTAWPKASPPAPRRPSPPASTSAVEPSAPDDAEGLRPDPPALAGPRPGRHAG